MLCKTPYDTAEGDVQIIKMCLIGQGVYIQDNSAPSPNVVVIVFPQQFNVHNTLRTSHNTSVTFALSDFC